MHPLIGLEFSGATLTPFDDLAPGEGALGRPVWGPAELLRDLELRLGLSSGDDISESLRTAQWAARMDQVVERHRFYSASFSADRLGTAQAVLELRDTLVSAGWGGWAFADGGPRLEAIAELEALGEMAVPPGVGDRVLRAATTLERRASSARLYDRLTLAESEGCWSGAWNRAFRALAAKGTEFSQLTVSLPGAPPDTDLGRVQTALGSRGECCDGGAMKGDGTLVLVRAETSFEAAEGAAALLSKAGAAECVVIREGDVSALDHALWVRRSATLGLSSASRWRPALQLLPLALELAFEPKDPFRVLELLGLSQGPFMGAVGRRLTRALARSPGIGGRAWEEAKARLAEPRDETLKRIAEWLETSGADPSVGAPKADLLRVIDRVRGFLTTRIARAPADPTLFAAVQHADAVVAALEADTRECFDLVSVRRLAEFALGAGARIEVLSEAAGRVAHVASAQALWVPRPTVLWWSFCSGTARSTTRGWRKNERVALERAGLALAQAGALDRQQWSGWRRAVGAATARLVLVAPRSVAGQVQRTHPLWDEIVARLRLDEVAQSRLTVSIDGLLSTADVATEKLGALALPAAPSTWQVTLCEPPRFSRHSAASLAALLGCPLRWALESLAGLDSEGTGLPPPHLLDGTLGHRLVEELVLEGAFTLDDWEFSTRAERAIDVLIQGEGALLLRSGKAHELAQSRQQLLHAVKALRAALAANRLSVLAVERPFEVPWRNATLIGRWDLLVSNAVGSQGVIDIKWGQSGYKKLLETGTALQLATYVRGLELLESTATFAAYFSLKGSCLFGPSGTPLDHIVMVRGPQLSVTWERIERTLPLVEARVAGGYLDVTGVRDALPLLDYLGVPQVHQADYFNTAATQVCEHCRFDGVCGKRWEPQQ